MSNSHDQEQQMAQSTLPTGPGLPRRRSIWGTGFGVTDYHCRTTNRRRAGIRSAAGPTPKRRRTPAPVLSSATL